MITPHTVTTPMRPVMRGPPKLATVVSQISARLPTNNGPGPLPSHGMNDDK